MTRLTEKSILFIFNLLAMSSLSQYYSYAATVPPINTASILVVHAQSTFHSNRSVRMAIDQEIEHAAKKRQTIIYLVSNSTPGLPQDWDTKNRRPDIIFNSLVGEHRLPLRNNTITIVGGYFGTYDMHRGALSYALRNAVNSYFNLENGSETFNIRLPLKAMYFWASDQALREIVIDRQKSPQEWMTMMLSLLFTSSDSTEMELGHRDLMIPAIPITTVPNPFTNEQNPPTNDSVSTLTDDLRRRIPDFDLYAKDPAIDVTDYSFEIFVDGKCETTFGRGSKHVHLYLER